MALYWFVPPLLVMTLLAQYVMSQIKITAGKTIALRGPCQRLVVFRIIPRG
jgi:hypothetical protein